MQITVVFDSLEEFQNSLKAVPETAPKATSEPETAPKATYELEAAPKATPEPEAAPETTPEPETAPEEEGTEELRAEIRGILAKVNKKSSGKNVARAIIKEFGVDTLSKVALSDLPALMKRAEEALNAE